MKLITTFSILFVLFAGSIFSQVSNYTISFDGTNDYVSVPYHASLDVGSGDFTIEAWIKRSVSNVRHNVLERNPGNGYVITFYIGSDNKVYGTTYEANNPTGVISNSTVGTTWTHIAFVRSSTTHAIYINGTLDNSASGTVRNFNANSTLNIGRYPGDNFYFNGQIDETRIWNAARTQQQLRDNMHKTVSAQSGLVGYWRFDAGTGTNAADSSGNGNHGTLQNSPTWNTSTVPLGSEGAFVNSNSLTSVGPSGGHMDVTITSTPGDANNLGIYQDGSLSSAPVTGESFPSGVDKRSAVVWGITERGSVTADIVLHYGGMGGISNELNIKVLKRTDAVSSWSNVTSDFSQNTTENTFTKTGETSFGEYSIGAGPDNPLPVELTSFNATLNAKRVHLRWQTATEINNYGFNIERRVESKTDEWQTIGFVSGNGTSNTPHSYSFFDQSPTQSGKYAYRLKQKDRDGSHTYSNVVEVHVGIPSTLTLDQNYPNPFSQSTKINFTLPASTRVSLKVFDVLGREVRVLDQGMKEAGSYSIRFGKNESEKAMPLAKGVYYYTLSTGKHSITKKMMVIE